METESTQVNTEEHNSKADQDQKDVELASRSLKAMSHPLRLMILCKLGVSLSRTPSSPCPHRLRLSLERSSVFDVRFFLKI